MSALDNGPISNPPRRRMVHFNCSLELLGEFMLLPQDCKIIRVQTDFHKEGMAVFVVESPEFREIEGGGAIPYSEPHYGTDAEGYPMFLGFRP